MAVYRDLLKHSSIYGIGQIFGRVASVVLLPLYTSCLSPADYGCVAILDLTAGILAVLIGAGMASAVNRFHFEAKDESERDKVWWSGLLYVSSVATLAVVPMWLARDLLSELTLGSSYANGAFFYSLALATMWCGVISEVLESYLRVRKWSGTFVSLSMGKLLVNIGLNVTFLVYFEMGIAGLLLGNLIAGALTTSILVALFIRSRGPVAFDRLMLTKLSKFGMPLIATALLSMVMHEADRYFLRIFQNMEQVGIYSLAYKVGQAVNTFCLIPFTAIWGVVLYEIAELPDAKQVYAKVFRYFVFGMSIVMLAASMLCEPIIALLTPNSYAEAIQLIPVILLAYLFYSFHSQFTVPAMLAKKTAMIVPSSVSGVVVNVAANIALIPIIGAAGAAWASVLTYATYSFVGLYFYRKIDRIPYAFTECAAVLVGIGATYFAYQTLWAPHLDAAGKILVGITACVAWSVLLFGSLV